MSRVTLELNLRVTYEIPDDANPDTMSDLEDNLLAIAQRASREGWLTQDTDAEVVVAAPHVEVLE